MPVLLIVSVLSFLQFLNAFFAIDVTLYDTPAFLTFFGITTFFTFFFVTPATETVFFLASVILYTRPAFLNDAAVFCILSETLGESVIIGAGFAGVSMGVGSGASLLSSISSERLRVSFTVLTVTDEELSPLL